MRINRLAIALTAAFFLFIASMTSLAVTDTTLTNTVKAKLATDKSFDQSKIKVNTKNGVVYLSGKVANEGAAVSAIQDAISVPGVLDVNTDKLSVSSSSQVYTDAYITAKVKGSFIREKLFGDAPIAVMSIKVETKDGVVYLTGTANTQAQEETAIKLAKSIKGVSDVQSNVMIKE